MSNSALKEQVGGNHYKNLKIQPIEYTMKNGLDFIQGNIIKYATRFKHKNGKEDLKKVIHYAELAIEFNYPNNAEVINKDISKSVYGSEIPDSVADKIHTERGYFVMLLAEEIYKSEHYSLEQIRKELAHVRQREREFKAKDTFRTESGHHFQD